MLPLLGGKVQLTEEQRKAIAYDDWAVPMTIGQRAGWTRFWLNIPCPDIVFTPDLPTQNLEEAQGWLRALVASA